jgi:hypothetical protein
MKPPRKYWSAPPLAISKSRVKLENIALVPASQLDSLAKWQRSSQQLPEGQVLIVVQSDNLILQHVGREIDRSLRLVGRRTCLKVI